MHLYLAARLGSPQKLLQLPGNQGELLERLRIRRAGREQHHVATVHAPPVQQPLEDDLGDPVVRSELCRDCGVRRGQPPPQ